MGFKETPGGGNVTFDCSPSGPCIPCSRSEKSDEKYRCSETGYRIRLKCFPSGSGAKDSESFKERKPRATLEVTDLGVNQHDTDVVISATRQRTLLDHSSKSKGRSNAYVTYRSCIPAVNEEKISVLGFENKAQESDRVRQLRVVHEIWGNDGTLELCKMLMEFTAVNKSVLRQF
ncbi:UNVERIFIED_CONTAM: hypothetical protein Sradi_4836900 [Sesamum radiatum]|uniref:Uncharacterized protein n=1 Tax=Sesamum radiatum TaxID=300843 RepID=A0AAW2N025_SESRA